MDDTCTRVDVLMAQCQFSPKWSLEAMWVRSAVTLGKQLRNPILIANYM